MRKYVAPPHPWRHACHTAQLQNTIGRAATVVTDNHYLSIADTQPKSILPGKHIVDGHTLFPQPLDYGAGSHVKLNDTDDCIFLSHCLLPCHQLKIGGKHFQCDFYDWCHLALTTVSNRTAAIIPYHIGSTCHRRRQVNTQHGQGLQKIVISHVSEYCFSKYATKITLLS